MFTCPTTGRPRAPVAKGATAVKCHTRCATQYGTTAAARTLRGRPRAHWMLKPVISIWMTSVNWRFKLSCDCNHTSHTRNKWKGRSNNKCTDADSFWAVCTYLCPSPTEHIKQRTRSSHTTFTTPHGTIRHQNKRTEYSGKSRRLKHVCATGYALEFALRAAAPRRRTSSSVNLHVLPSCDLRACVWWLDGGRHHQVFRRLQTTTRRRRVVWRAVVAMSPGRPTITDWYKQGRHGW